MTVDVAKVRELFPGAEAQVYLDNAAIGLLSIRSGNAIAQVTQSHLLRGGAAKPEWMDTVARARLSIAALVGGHPDRIAFTQNTSTGLALVANGIDWTDRDNVAFPSGEFPSNSYIWQQLRHNGVQVRGIDMTSGHADLGKLAEAVDSRTRVVAVSAVQYSSGYRYDLAHLAEVCRAHDALLVVDGTQAVGAMRVDVDAAYVDVLAVAGHKWMLGPLGAGFVHFSDRAMDRLRPSTVGWRSVDDPLAFDREPRLALDARRFESGTENATGIAGLAAAVELVHELGAATVEKAILARTEELVEALTSVGLTVDRDPEPARWSGIVVATTGGDDRTVHERLLEADVRCSLRGGLRFAPHVFTNTADIDAAVRILAEINV